MQQIESQTHFTDSERIVRCLFGQPLHDVLYNTTFAYITERLFQPGPVDQSNMPLPAEFYQRVDQNAQKFIDRLKQAVNIPSVSTDASYRQRVFDMAEFVKSEMTKLKIDIRTVDLGNQTLKGETVKLPPAILGTLGKDSNKKTVLLYAHYDVQPVRYDRS